MKKISIRKRLMENLGINQDEASALIRINSQRNKGNVNVYQIEKEISTLANSMIYQVGNVYKDYDLRHELRECGKNRVERAILTLLDEEEGKIASQYLESRYADTVDTWAETFYHTVQNKLQSIIGDGIDSYRKFVKTLPYQNINRVARTFDMENQIAEFIGINGTEQDFQKFMTDVEPIRGTDEIERRSCPRNLSKKIFLALKKSIQEKNFKNFSREEMMSGLSTIHNSKKLKPEEKEELQDLFMKYSLAGEVGEDFNRLVRSGIGIEFSTLKEYLEMGTENKAMYQKEFIKEKIASILEKDIAQSYEEFTEKIEKEMQEEILTPEAFIEALKKTKLSQNERNSIIISEDEENQKTKLVVYVYSPDIRENIAIELDGTKLKSIIDSVNSNSLSKAQEQLRQLVESGMGEISVCDNYDVEEYEDYNRRIFGALNKDEKSPYLIGGEVDENYGVTDLQIKVPYSIVSNSALLGINTAGMTEEQIKAFNKKAEAVDVQEHTYTDNSADGYHTGYVYDFEAGGEKYHMENINWLNGGRYSIIWKGEETSCPKKAIGLTSSNSKLDNQQTGVREDTVIRFIKSNPTRFSEYYDSHAKARNNCGVFEKYYIEAICQDVMKMPTESTMRSKQEDIGIPDSENDEFLDNIANSAKQKTELKDKKDKAVALLKEYEQLLPVKALEEQ